LSNRYNRDGAGATIDTAALDAASIPTRSEISRFYTLSFVDGEPTANTFRLQAVPINAMANDRCGTFVLSHTAEKALGSGDEALRRDCWER
jgi:type IV pilus assembly protein PilE